MLKRNKTLQIRSIKSTLAQTLVAPLLFMTVLAIMQSTDNANQLKSLDNPQEYTLGLKIKILFYFGFISLKGGVTRCVNGDTQKGCINLMFSPQNDQIVSILTVTFLHDLF